MELAGDQAVEAENLAQAKAYSTRRRGRATGGCISPIGGLGQGQAAAFDFHGQEKKDVRDPGRGQRTHLGAPSRD